MSTPTITEFLMARIEEDEVVASKLASHNAGHSPGTKIYTGSEWVQSPLTAERALAECAAKRAIIGEQFEYAATIDGEWGCAHYADEIRAGKCHNTDLNARQNLPLIFALAAVYKDHPDYQEAWA